jgi:hypothetical protein
MVTQNPFHTPEEMRLISDLAHRAEGVVLGVAALIALVQAGGLFQRGRQRYAWPAMVLGAGILLLGYLLIPFHGLANARAQWHFVVRDPQQRHHLIMAILVAIGGIGETVARSRKQGNHRWHFVWPAVLVVVGLFFVFHQQHGTSDAVARAALVHRMLGTSMIVAGVFATIAIVRPVSRAALILWPLALLASATLLLLYREPAGAYHH